LWRIQNILRFQHHSKRARKPAQHRFAKFIPVVGRAVRRFDGYLEKNRTFNARFQICTLVSVKRSWPDIQRRHPVLPTVVHSHPNVDCQRSSRRCRRFHVRPFLSNVRRESAHPCPSLHPKMGRLLKK
jgi:hypothetical protein